MYIVHPSQSENIEMNNAKAARVSTYHISCLDVFGIHQSHSTIQLLWWRHAQRSEKKPDYGSYKLRPIGWRVKMLPPCVNAPKVVQSSSSFSTSS